MLNVTAVLDKTFYLSASKLLFRNRILIIEFIKIFNTDNNKLKVFYVIENWFLY
jgi:hypothetical protein